MATFCTLSRTKNIREDKKSTSTSTRGVAYIKGAKRCPNGLNLGLEDCDDRRLWAILEFVLSSPCLPNLESFRVHSARDSLKFNRFGVFGLLTFPLSS